MPEFRNLRRSMSVWTGIFALCTPHGVAQAQDLTFYGALTTDYVYRGISRSDRHGAVQLGVDISSEMGLFGGVWASTTDTGTAERHRSREVDFYVGYVKYFGSDWSASASVNRYTFPGQTSDLNYNYDEFAALIGYRDRVWMGIDLTKSLFGHDTSARNYEILVNWPLAASLSVTAGFGYFDVSDFAGNGYSYWQLGITRPIAWAAIDLRYHDTNNVPAQIAPDRLADPTVVLTISAAY